MYNVTNKLNYDIQFSVFSNILIHRSQKWQIDRKRKETDVNIQIIIENLRIFHIRT